MDNKTIEALLSAKVPHELAEELAGIVADRVAEYITAQLFGHPVRLTAQQLATDLGKCLCGKPAITTAEWKWGEGDDSTKPPCLGFEITYNCPHCGREYTIRYAREYVPD